MNRLAEYIKQREMEAYNKFKQWDMESDTLVDFRAMAREPYDSGDNNAADAEQAWDTDD